MKNRVNVFLHARGGEFPGYHANRQFSFEVNFSSIATATQTPPFFPTMDPSKSQIVSPRRKFPPHNERPSTYELSHQPHTTEAGPAEVGPSYATAVHPQQRGRTKRSTNTIGSAGMILRSPKGAKGHIRKRMAPARDGAPLVERRDTVEVGGSYGSIGLTLPPSTETNRFKGWPLARAIVKGCVGILFQHQRSLCMT